MRTTLNIDDAAMEAIKKHAQKRSVSLGEAASDLIFLGVESIPKFKTKNGWAILESPPGAPVITNELIEAGEMADYEEEYQRAISPRR